MCKSIYPHPLCLKKCEGGGGVKRINNWAGLQNRGLTTILTMAEKNVPLFDEEMTNLCEFVCLCWDFNVFLTFIYLSHIEEAHLVKEQIISE